MIDERIPEDRLITKNLLSSASYYQRVDSTPWAAIQDLSTLIDLICFYDKAYVLGSPGRNILSFSNDLLAFLQDIHFLVVKSNYDQKKDIIAATTSKHLIQYLGEEDSEHFLELLYSFLEKPETLYLFDEIPDTDLDIKNGKLWLVKVSSRKQILDQLFKEEEINRGVTFLLRTFVYFAYANVMKIAFTPDSVRIPILEKALDEEEKFRGRLIQTLDSTFGQTIQGNYDELQRFSPCSSTVFTRANRKKDIVNEISKLRDEFKPTRERLRALEHKMIYENFGDLQKAKQNWNNIMEEVKRNYGLSPEFVNLRQGLNFAEDVADIAVKPKDPKSWFDALLHLPFEIVIRLLNQRPVIELHRLKRELKGPGVLYEKINQLFSPL